MEATLRGHSGGAPFLKDFMTTSLKAISTFLSDCEGRIKAAEGSGATTVDVIDLTLDEEDIQVIYTRGIRSKQGEQPGGWRGQKDRVPVPVASSARAVGKHDFAFMYSFL